MKKIEIYTDGACSGNPGAGGWGAILIYGQMKKEISGGERMTTNNRMELLAVINALEILKEQCEITVFSDSQYVVNGINKGWAKGWQRNGWKKSNKEPALNPDLWERLLELCSRHKVSFVWVKGHAQNEYNNRCDRLAVSAYEQFK